MTSPREILIESIQVGTSVRVTAIDTETGTEIVFQAPVTASKATIKRVAADKMKFVLAKQKGNLKS